MNLNWKEMCNEMWVCIDETEYLNHTDGIFLQMNVDVTTTITQFL